MPEILALPEIPALPEIYVDADACPVKPEVERVADRHGLTVHIVSNGGIRPSFNPRVKTVIVSHGADAADDWIAEHIGASDIAITADIPLASRCLKKGAAVLGPTGKPFSEQSIGMALGMRDLHQHLREATGQQTFNAGFTKQDRSQFLNALENAVQAAKRIGR
ncbi:MAG TPA: YaiI/YqxD family protein [Rhizomicrobium sp.]